jgi:hypothetical protein
MPQPHRRPRGPKPDRRRALELLAASPDGCTEALMFANGFTAELLVELMRAGLASAHAERMVADGRMMEAARMKISEAGWQALAGDAISGGRNQHETPRVHHTARRRGGRVAGPGGRAAGDAAGSRGAGFCVASRRGHVTEMASRAMVVTADLRPYFFRIQPASGQATRCCHDD